VSSTTRPEGARYEIAIDGTPMTYRDLGILARQAAALLKAAQPHGASERHEQESCSASRITRHGGCASPRRYCAS